MAVLLVEQNIHRSLAVTDRACIIERGRIVMSGTPEELLQDDNFQKAYFGI